MSDDRIDMNDEDRRTRITTISRVFSGKAYGNECLVEIYGTHIGRKYDLFEDVVTIGRDSDNSISLESDSVSRRHARIERFNDSRFIVDLKSTNGTYVNDVPAEPRSKLKSGVFIKIGDTIFKYLTGDNIEAAYHEEIYRSVVTDGLTQISNKRALDEFLDREVARARRHERNLSVLMLDIDHFKAINDTHGHLTGDYVLKELAGLIRTRMRREELFARYGGEEFIIALPETDVTSAKELAEALRALVHGHEFAFEGAKIRVTISIGVGQFDKSEHRSPHDLIKTADKNLYVAKNKGRNCVHG